MPKLEKYIKDHLDEFDAFEPDPGHFKRFEDRVGAVPVLSPFRFNRAVMLKVAALILVMISVSVIVFDFATSELRVRIFAENQGSELPLEIREAVRYYDNQATIKIAAIQKLSVNQQDADVLKNSAISEIQNLDATTEELKRSLAKNPGNEHILDAIIQNQQMKETMLNTILTQLSLARK
ncbi:MAG: hypothetical protein Q8M08_06765 [Bacteroidales bacterium]|nr:hypothetical protein [Bacteroidales bacterium]